VKPGRALADGIQQHRGMTSFDNALSTAHEVSTKSKFEKYIFFFMSDGGSTFSTDVTGKFTNDPNLSQNMNFYSVGFG